MAADEFVELRIYKIHHGRRSQFEYSMRTVVLPMFRRQGINIVHHGPSAHDKDSYFLIRAYPSIADRKQKLNAVFGDEEWLMHHESYIMDMINIISTAMFPADEGLIRKLKESFEGEAAEQPVAKPKQKMDR